MLTSSGEWRKHLRWMKRGFWKGERQAGRRDARRELAEPETVWRSDSPDGTRWLLVERRSDGLFQYSQWKSERVLDPVFGDYDDVGPVQESGLFESLDDARGEAVLTADWLSEHSR